ncbi:MAG: palindromic element RPE2 domain-containing protein [Rickettsia sp.]|jgi:RPE2 domain-containing protein|nr:palindromic element RPE2 domain-containing protein [Rickettsia sp.]
MGRNKHNQGDWANHFRKYNFSKQDKPLSKEVEPLKLYTAKDMLLLTTLSMIRPNSIDDKDNLSAHYIAKRAISEGYTNAGYTLENTTTPKHNTPEKSTSHNQDIVNSGGFGARSDGATPICNRRATSDDVTNFSSIDYSGIIMLIGSTATGCVIIGFVGIAACKAYKNFGSKNKNVDHPTEVCKSSDSKNEHVDYSVDTNLSIITIPLEEIQDISLAGNTTTQVEQ